MQSIKPWQRSINRTPVRQQTHQLDGHLKPQLEDIIHTIHFKTTPFILKDSAKMMSHTARPSHQLPDQKLRRNTHSSPEGRD